MTVQIERGSPTRIGHKRDTAHLRGRHLPCALTVGGLDPGGGAGVLADLRAFDRAGVFGCAVIALSTVQSTAGLRSVHVEPAKQVVAQLREVLDSQNVRAIKVGALGSREVVRAVARELRLLEVGAVPDVVGRLLPSATLVTVNVDEAGALFGCRVTSLEDAREAARRIAEGGARAVLVKGGHLRGPLATDVLAIDGELFELHAPRLRGAAVHGTGCTLASLIAGRIAHASGGPPTRGALLSAVRWAKRVHHATMARAVRVGNGMRVMTP